MASLRPWNELVHGRCVVLSRYEEFYKDLHRYPELSLQENRTSAKIVAFLKTLGPDLDIRTGIGGTGLIAILRNGAGRTILLRADMDALPLQEKTGLEYASKEQGIDSEGNQVPIMHACGHDFHVTCLLGAAETFLSCCNEWSGTIILLFQPAEEGHGGAQAMVDDGLYTRHECPIPDVVLAQHVAPLRAGMVSLKKGPLLAASDGFKVTIYGLGGHGSMPQYCIDPIVIAAHIVIRLQTIVSREVPPNEQAVVSVCSLHAGSAENIISDTAEFLVNVRSLSIEWRVRILESIKRIIRAECEASNCSQEPEIVLTHSTPLTMNGAAVTEPIIARFSSFFGDNFVADVPTMTGSEDISVLATSVDVPYCFWFFGGHEASVWNEHYARGALKQLPSNHSSTFAPTIHPTLRTGIDALVIATMTFVSNQGEQSALKH